MMYRNAVQCAKCKDIIHSKHRHDFVYCSCKSIYIDGGMDYLRAGGDPENFIGLGHLTDEEFEEYKCHTVDS